LLRLEAAAQQAPPALADELRETRALAAQAMDELLRLARELRPSALDDHGLPAALRSQVERFSAETGIAATLSMNESLESLDDNEQIVVYRMVQESLSNVTRHAQAHHVTVETVPGPAIRVSDDGQGFDTARADGNGLVGMRERARLAGATVDVQSRAGAGTTVELRLEAAA
ncbi:MAG TPA: ATP-binding protein, partial [Baekduia sp.]|nr:ATP-binding protein [Baekduia sp.]